jgi:hypothetical protein
MPHILRDEMIRKKVMILSARSTLHRLDPQKILRLCRLAGPGAGGLKQMPYLRPQMRPKRQSSFGISCEFQILYFLSHDPPGHRIDIRSRHGTPESVRLHHRRPPTHEWIKDVFVREIMGPKVSLIHPFSPKFR